MVFRSAFNYLSQAGSNLLSGNEQHPLVGQTLEIGGRSLVVRSLLAEGGYALVFSVQDSRNGEWFALKRQLAADRIAADAVAQEIRILKKLSGHQAIIRFFHATQTAPDKRSAAGPQHFAEFMLLTELCSGGPLIDYIRKAEPLNVQQICKIIYALASAVQHMHDRNPPITHRDIKVENLLIDTHGFIKLCDFGSATTDIYRPDEDWSVMMRNQLEEEMAKFTTPMYRAPEILETYQNYPVGPPQDIWALGCVLFYLCFRIHPFEDSAKLRIINAKYNLPTQSPFQIFHDLIKRTLQPDPYSRPSIQDLCEQIEDIALALNLDLSQPFLSPEQLETLTSAAAETSAPQIGTSNSAPNQPTTSRLIFDQGMNLIKTIKEKTPPVSSISEQLRTHLGFDAAPLNQPNSRGPSSQQQQAEKRGNVAPPRPLAPPTIQTRTSQLPTQKESVEEEHRQPISSTSSSTSKAEEKKPTHHQNSQLHKEEKPRKKLTQEQQQPINVGATTTDFFSTLDWNTSEKQKEQQKQKPKKQHIYDQPKATSDTFPSAENEFGIGILGDLQQPFSNSIGQEKNNRVGVDHLLAEFGLSENDAHSQVPPSHPPSHRPHEDGVGKAESSAELDVLKLLEEEEIGISSQATAMFRNKSAPDFASAPTTILKGKGIPTEHATNPKTSDDIFAEFLSGMETHSQGSQYQRPNYSRKNFDKTEEFKMEQKTKANTGNVAFDDLFSFQGFTSSRQSNVKTLADLTKERDAQEMDPIALKIKYWTAGKQRNIRALLGSLSEVLWEDAKPNWSQPSVAELFEADKIKKHYRRACLVVHPDKQLGTEQELLAKAIFTELNDAWNEFLKNTQ